jgi:hypothetical protein
MFRSYMCDTCFPKHFWVPSNIVKYDSKKNLSLLLEDYHLACRMRRGAGGGGTMTCSPPPSDNNLFIIKFLPIYLADSARA